MAMAISYAILAASASYGVWLLIPVVWNMFLNSCG